MINMILIKIMKYISMDQQVLIFNSIVNIFIFILGLCLHEGLMTLVWMLAFSGLRVNLGGYHCDSPVKCFVSSNLIFFLSMLSYKYLSSYFLLLFIPLGILFMLFFKYIPFINKKAKITICIELYLFTYSKNKYDCYSSFMRKHHFIFNDSQRKSQFIM